MHTGTQAMENDIGGGEMWLPVFCTFAGARVQTITPYCYRQSTGWRHVTANIVTGAT